MKALTRKLKSKSGISLAIALVFFLLCVMAGTVALSAVSVNAGNTARERQLYRETLALTSAAELLREDVQSMRFTGVTIKKEIVTTTVFPDQEGQSTQVKTEEIKEFGKPEISGSHLFKINESTDGTETTYSDSLNLTERYCENQGLPAAVPGKQAVVINAVEEQNIPEVRGSVEVEADYTLTVILTCGGSSLTMSFPPHSDLKTEVNVPILEQDGNTSIKTTETAYSTTLNWGQPIIKEGDVSHA